MVSPDYDHLEYPFTISFGKKQNITVFLDVMSIHNLLPMSMHIWGWLLLKNCIHKCSFFFFFFMHHRYRSSIAGSCKNNSKYKNVKNRKWRHKNKNRINQFFPHFSTSKLFKVIFTDFFAKKQKLRNSVFERQTLFFQK